MVLFALAIVLASAASNTRGAVSVTLWTLAGVSLAASIYTRTPAGRASFARRLAWVKADQSTAFDKGRHEKQSLEKLKRPKPKIARQLDEPPSFDDLKDGRKRSQGIEGPKATLKERAKKRATGR